MNNKFYISLEVARLLKEKGYNEETICYYNSAGKLYLGNGHFNYNAYAVNLSAPTKAEAIDWLESKGIYISVYYRELTGKYFCEIHYNKMKYNYKESDLTEDYKTRLEAEEAVIIKGCRSL